MKRKYIHFTIPTRTLAGQSQSHLVPFLKLTSLLANVDGHQNLDACLSTIDDVIPVFVFDVIDYVYVADCFRRTVYF